MRRHVELVVGVEKGRLFEAEDGGLMMLVLLAGVLGRVGRLLAGMLGRVGRLLAGMLGLLIMMFAQHIILIFILKIFESDFFLMDRYRWSHLVWKDSVVFTSRNIHRR